MTVQSAETINRLTHSVDLKQCQAAMKEFNLDKPGIDSQLVAGIIWNEQLHLKPTDSIQDWKASSGEALEPSESVGLGQIQIRNLARLAAEYPQLRRFGNPVQAAADPTKAPFFVAAYLASESRAIENYNRQHPEQPPIPVTTETLAYRYNPDVYSHKSGDLRSLEPWEKLNISAVHGWQKLEFPTKGVLGSSNHVRKVMNALNEVKRKSDGK